MHKKFNYIVINVRIILVSDKLSLYLLMIGAFKRKLF